MKQQLRRWHWRRSGGEPAPQAGQELVRPALDGDSPEGRLGRITSVLELADGERIGLAMVRRAGLDAPRLQAGAAQLSLSLPEQFAAPPVGAGGGS